MTPEKIGQSQEHEGEKKSVSSTPLDSLRQAGCKLVNRYCMEGVDQVEVFGVTRAQFERAVDLEHIRRGSPDNALIAALYHENDRLKGDLSRLGLHIDSAIRGHTRDDEPASLSRRLDLVRALARQVQQLGEKKDDEDGFFFAA